MQSQITIHCQLNPEKWYKLLQGYWDRQLPLLIRFGLPLDFDRKVKLVSHSDNHSSAKAYPDYIKAYLHKDIAHKAILGPYREPPISGLLM